MRSFFLKYTNGNISTYEYINNELNVLRNKGEEEQPYEDDDVFWNWWREKVDYQDEEVSFLIMTDQNKFDIPDDIIISKKNLLSKEIVSKKIEIQNKRLKTISYPLSESIQKIEKIIDEKFTKETLDNTLKPIKIGVNSSILTILSINEKIQYVTFFRTIKRIFMSNISFINRKIFSPIMQIPKTVWNKIEKEKEKRADKLEQLKIKSETRL